MDRDLRIRMLLEASDRVTRPLREMAAGGRDAAGALKATRDRLKDIDKAQADIASFRALNEGLDGTAAKMNAARSHLAKLGQEMASVEKPTRDQTRALAAAQREADRLTTEYRDQNGELGKLHSRLQAAGVETAALARHEVRLQRDAAAANAEIEEQSRRLGAAADRARRFAAARDSFGRVQTTAVGMAASGAAAIGTGTALAAPVVGAIGAAQTYQSVMTDIAQKAGMSRVEADRLGRTLLVAARAANQMPADMQAGVDTLAGMGASVPDAVKMMTPIGRAATAYGAEISDLSAAAYAAVDNLKVPVDQVGRTIEMMAYAGKAGAFEVKDMAAYIPSLAAAYQGMGQTGVDAVGDLAAALQIVRKGTGDSASAATNLSNILQKMNSQDAIRNFAKLGVDLPAALKKAAADGKSPIEAITELTNSALKGDLSKLGLLFADAQVQQGLRPLIQNLQLFRKLRGDTQGKASIGMIDSDFAERMNDSAEQTRQMQVNAAALGVTLGTTLLPSVNAVLSRVNAFASHLNAWAQANPGFAKGLMIAAAVAATLFIVLGGGAIAIAGLLAPFAALSYAATALGLGMLPVIGIAFGVVAAVAALGAAAYLIYRHWGDMGAWFTGVWQRLKQNTMNELSWWMSLPDQFRAIGGWLINGLISGITGGLPNLRNVINDTAASAAQWFRDKLGIRSPSRLFMTYGGFITEGLARGIAGGAGAPVDRLRALVARVQDTIAAPLAFPAAGGAPPIGPPYARPDVAARVAAAGMALAVAAPAAATPVVTITPIAERAATARPATSLPVTTATIGPFHVTINQQPGQSPDDMAAAFRRMIDDLRREEEARARATFRDVPDYDSLD